MDIGSIYSQRHKVLTFMVDFDCRISVPSVFMLLQEAAWHHANDHNLGYAGLRSKGMFWVLSRMHVEMLYYPQWTDEINIETWSKPPDMLTAYRDFEGYGNEGNKFMRATSSWIILDAENSRPQCLGDYASHFPHFMERHAIEQKARKIPAPCGSAVSARGKVQPSDIDMHQHVNNTRYVQWVMDSLGFEFLKEFEASSIEVNFLSQAKVNDSYSIALTMEEESCVAVILNEADSREMARLRMLWRRRQHAGARH